SSSSTAAARSASRSSATWWRGSHSTAAGLASSSTGPFATSRRSQSSTSGSARWDRIRARAATTASARSMRPSPSAGCRSGPAVELVRGTGWLPDWPDHRDYTAEHPELRPELESLGIAQPSDPASLPLTVDLRPWFSPIEDQGALGSCTANAGMGVLEYYERRAFGKHIDGSRLFLYKVTRDLLGWTGDTGAFLRTTMGALALFGAPPEKYWPYVIARFDIEPSAFLYSFGQDYRALK